MDTQVVEYRYTTSCENEVQQSDSRRECDLTIVYGSSEGVEVSDPLQLYAQRQKTDRVGETSRIQVAGERG